MSFANTWRFAGGGGGAPPGCPCACANGIAHTIIATTTNEFRMNGSCRSYEFLPDLSASARTEFLPSCGATSPKRPGAAKAGPTYSTLIRHHIAVARRTDAAHQHAGFRMNHDGLHRSDAAHVPDIQLVPHRRKLVEHRLGNERRNLQRALGRVWIVRALEPGADDRRLLERLLHGHPELGDVQE